MIDPTEDFPWNVGAYLAECRESGIDFDDAWTAELDNAARDAGFGWQQHPFTVETALSFAKRHLRAAYELRDTPTYCAHDCAYLAIDGDLCIMHSEQGKAAAA